MKFSIKFLLDFFKNFCYNIYTVIKKGIKKMKNTNKLEILKNRLAIIENKGKSTGGVQRKLQRQIRNLSK